MPRMRPEVFTEHRSVTLASSNHHMPDCEMSGGPEQEVRFDHSIKLHIALV
jgi:hypothetical protein